IRHVMLRMVALTGGELARRRVPLSELEYPPEKNDLVKEVIERFTNARLLVNGVDADGNTYVEPAHDALVRGWQRLLEWKQKDEESLILQRRLTPVAQEWKSVQNKKQPSGFQAKAEPAINWLDRKLNVVENLFNKINYQINTQLLRLWKRTPDEQETSTEKPLQFLWNADPYLDVLDKELNSDDNWFNQVEAEFVQQSVKQKRRNVSWRWRIAIAVMVGLSGLATAAILGQQEAQRQQRKANIQEIDALREAAEANWQSNNQLEALIASLRAGKNLKERRLLQESENSKQREEVVQTLRRVVSQIRERDRMNKPIGEFLSVTPDHNILVKNNSIQDTRYLNSEGKEVKLSPRFIFSRNPLNYNPGIIYSPDGKLFATADIAAIPGDQENNNENGNVYLWNWDNKKLKVKLSGHQGGVKSFSFSPDSRILAVVDGNDTIHFWDVERPQGLFKNTQYRNIVGVGFTPDNDPRVATSTTGISGYKVLTLWDLRGKQLSTIYGDYADSEKSFDKVFFSADGKQIAIEYGIIPGYQTDAERFIKIVLWNYLEDESHKNSQTTKFVSKLYSVPLEAGDISTSISLDGKELFTAYDNSHIRIWDLREKNNRLTKLKLDANKIPKAISISLDADGKQLAIVNQDGKVYLGDLTNGTFNLIPEISGNTKIANFSPDGKVLATVSQDGIVGLLHLKSRKFDTLPKQFSRPISNINFSPDSKKLVIATENKEHKILFKVYEFKYKTKESTQNSYLVYHNNYVFFDSKNKLNYLVRNEVNRKTTLHDFKTEILLTKFQENQCELVVINYDYSHFRVSLSGDKTLVASTDTDSVCVWDMEKGDKLVKFKVTQGKNIKNISLSADGTSMAILLDDGSIELGQIGGLDYLLSKGCDWVRDYLKNNPNVEESDRHLCDNVPKLEIAED
ncbi:WD40 repeat domain-containing protein, partial [Moorena sp. SIO3I6]|uniref:WD40 repeat domain-containing protein n=1 Tax=Moorena sp. SIO3I6 TaxID=2607831 RepID=UPI0013FA31D5